MNQYIALLRGINVGGKTLAMKDLIAVLQRVGCANIRTYIQSGNVVFSSDVTESTTLEEHIRAGVIQSCGLDVTVIVLTVRAWQTALAGNPFPIENGRALHLFFLASVPVAPDLNRLESLKTEMEKYLLSGQVFYLYTPDGFGRSKLAEKAEKCLGVAATARNWNTVSQLNEMLQKG